MRNAVRTKPVMTWLLASAAVFSFAHAAQALSDGSLSREIEDSRDRDSVLQQAFEGTTLPRTGLSLEGETGSESATEGEGTEPAAGDASSETTGETTGETGKADGSKAAETAATETAPAEIIRDLSTLPDPVKDLRQRIVEAAASGDIERLRPLFEGTPKPPQIMNGESDDPIDTLKNFSGDAEGQEILAIMLDILSTGAARIDAGTAEETYVWPYFVGKPLSSLTAPERVDLLRIVTAGDLMGMEENGNYNFYRLGISPDGQWKFLSGGD